MGRWEDGFAHGYAAGLAQQKNPEREYDEEIHQRYQKKQPKPKRKLSAWNRFVKANSKKPRFIFKSNTSTHKKGQLNLKKMGVAFHKTPDGKASKKRR